MSKVESKTGKINLPNERIYDFLSDFNNFSSILPPGKVQNWSAGTDSCRFTVEGIGDASLRITDKNPHSLIQITADPPTPISFLLSLYLKKIDSSSTEINIVLEPDANPLVMAMLKAPLQEFVDKLIDQAETIVFN